MIKFPELYKEFVQKKDCTKKREHVWLCPDCKDHEQGEPMDVHDCKTIIYEDELTPDGKLQGGNEQCGCYSKEHGMRGE